MDVNNMGESLKKLRTEAGYSTESLAYLSGIHYNTIRRIERGHDTSVSTIVKLLNTLGVELEIKEMK